MSGVKRAVAAKTANYEVGERILCYNHGSLYEAKILKVKSDGEDVKYHVHYIGWKSTWDEDVTEEVMLKRTEENLRKRHEMLAAAAATQQTKRKNERDDGDGDDKASKRGRGASAGAGAATAPGTEGTRRKTIIELPLPENVIAHLINDWEMVTKDQRLVDLPRTPTVTEVLERFAQSDVFAARKDPAAREVLEAVRLYFDVALGKMLLYRFERQQYATVRAERGDKARMSDVYGCEHLLRLLVKLPQLVSNNVHMARESQAGLTSILTDLVAYLSGSLGELVLESYENASPAYISVSKTF